MGTNLASMRRQQVLGQMPDDDPTKVQTRGPESAAPSPLGPMTASPDAAPSPSPTPPSNPGSMPVSPMPDVPVGNQPESAAAPMMNNSAAPDSAAAPVTNAAANPFNYEAARDDWMGNNAYNVGNQDAARASAAQWAQQHGIAYDGSSDTIQLPNGGGAIDILGNFKSGQNIARNWTPAGGNGPMANGGPSTLGSGVAGGDQAAAPLQDAPTYRDQYGRPTPLGPMMADPTKGIAGHNGDTGGDMDGMLRQQLLSMMQGANAPIDPNSPQIKQTMDAARLTGQRALESNRKSQAEQLYGSGGTQSGAYDAGLQQSAERMAGGLAQTQADAMMGEHDAKRQQASHALDLATAMGARKEAGDLQRQLADLDNQYRYAALSQQKDLAGMDDKYRYSALGQQKDLAGMDDRYRWGALGQNQGQFEDTSAFNWAQFQQQLNRQALLSGMAGNGSL